MTYANESNFQRDVIRGIRARHPEWVVLHVPNEGKRSKILGHIMKTDGLLPGTPDVVVACLRKTLWIECKLSGGRITPPQKAIIKALLENNHNALVAYSDGKIPEAELDWLRQHEVDYCTGYEQVIAWVERMGE